MSEENQKPENVEVPNISLTSKNIKTRFMESISKSNKSNK